MVCITVQSPRPTDLAKRTPDILRAFHKGRDCPHPLIAERLLKFRGCVIGHRAEWGKFRLEGLDRAHEVQAPFAIQTASNPSSSEARIICHMAGPDPVPAMLFSRPLVFYDGHAQTAQPVP